MREARGRVPVVAAAAVLALALLSPGSWSAASAGGQNGAAALRERPTTDVGSAGAEPAVAALDTEAGRRQRAGPRPDAGHPEAEERARDDARAAPDDDPDAEASEPADADARRDTDDPPDAEASEPADAEMPARGDARAAARAEQTAARARARERAREAARAAEEARQRAQARLDAAAQDLEEVDAGVLAAVAGLDAATERLSQAQTRLRDLRGQVRVAQAARRRAEERADDAATMLGQATMVVLATESALARHAADLRVQLATAYKYAGTTARLSGIVEALHTSGSLTRFITAYDQLELGAEQQHGLVVDIGTLAERLRRERAATAAVRIRREAAAYAAERTRDATVALLAEQRRLVAQVTTQRAGRRELVARLRTVQAAERRRVEQLAAASAALGAQLAAPAVVVASRATGSAPATGQLAWPTDGPLTSGFGYRVHPILLSRRLHAGADIGAPLGQAVFAAADGTVLSAGTRGGYGTTVLLDHGGGMTSVYAHLSALAVRAGERVEQGDAVGLVGSTGNSTGPHLHFEVRVNGLPRDPLGWF